MRIEELMKSSERELLSIYCTAGYPKRNSLPQIIRSLESAGVDFVEVGIPYSDPLCDGPTIQASSAKALVNGITLDEIFEQLTSVETKMPLILMGYFNVILQYGVEAFCKACADIRVSGVILPDLPLEIYIEQYKAIFERYGLHLIFLVTPQTSQERIRQIDQISESFIYAVSSSSTTGQTQGISKSGEYLQRLKDMNLKHPIMIGFNISTKMDFDYAVSFGRGGIIGSAFIKSFNDNKSIQDSVPAFINQIKHLKV